MLAVTCGAAFIGILYLKLHQYGKSGFAAANGNIGMTLKEKLHLSRDPLFLMDGTAYLYRSFYANRHLARSDGFPTNALVLVTRVLLRILRQENPQWFLFAMDGKGRNFRHDIYPDYKANREAMPGDLVAQIEPARAMVRALGLRLEVTDGFEADDCIASLAARFCHEMPVIIVSGDKDLKQCLGPDVFMWDPGSKEEKIITLEDFEMENGVAPAQWPDVQALVGDSSDNIPGVPGIGPKTARQIFEHCSSLEDIRARSGVLPQKIRDKLEPHLEEMFKWRKLTTLKTDACENISLADLKVGPINSGECARLAREFELAAVGREIAGLEKRRLASSAGLPEIEAEEAREERELGDAPLPPARALADIGELPACAGLDVGVFWLGPGKGAARFALGLVNDSGCPMPQEFEWQGQMADFCAWLASARRIIVPALKELLVDSPSWRGLLEKRGHAGFVDLGLATYVLNPEEGDYSWPRLARRWRESLKCENAGPAALALAMAGALERNLEANGQLELYANMEMPLIQVLAAMQERGFAIDPAAFRAFLLDVQKELEALEAEIYKEAGIHFNIRSSRQLGEILVDKFHLSGIKKTKSGLISTSQANLEKLAPNNPFVENVLQARKLEKMRSTYLDPLPRLMDPNNRIHSTFNQEATATGRLSSSDPNLQNIPVRGPMGARMRSCFVAAPGHSLVAADYSQIELRILAHLSKDPALLGAFRDGADIHAATAALVFDKPQDEILPDERRMAKTINFGLLYGMGASKLSQELKITPAKAREFIERYFAGLATLKNFYDEILVGAREHGYVSTMAGRRRWVPGIFSDNGQEQAQAQRQAINAVIQGSAADVIKLAMLAVANNDKLREYGASLVLQVHDELLLEAPENVAAECGPIVARLMEDVHPGGQVFSIPLLVDWGTGPNWGLAH